jgi:hypothetical protein
MIDKPDSEGGIMETKEEYYKYFNRSLLNTGEPKWFHPGTWWIKRVFLFVRHCLSAGAMFLVNYFRYISGDSHLDNNGTQDPTSLWWVKLDYDGLVDTIKEFGEVVSKGFHAGYCLNNLDVNLSEIIYHTVKKYREELYKMHTDNDTGWDPMKDPETKEFYDDLDHVIWAFKHSALQNDELSLTWEENTRKKEGIKKFAKLLPRLWF